MDQKQQALRSILEVAPVGIYILNKKGEVEYLNSTMVAISGDSHEQLRSLNILELKQVKDLGLDKKIRAVFEGNAFSLGPLEYTSVFSKKMTIRNFLGVPFEEDNQKKALIFVEDITQIKLAEQEKEKAINIKSHFISMVSHELRTPLAIIKEYIDIVQDGTAGPLNKKQQGFLDTAKQNVERLSRLINNVLDFQKLQAGRMEFKMQTADINQCIEGIAKEMLPLIKDKGLKLDLKLNKDIPKIKFDWDKTTQVLTNLINNAIKFTGKGSISLTSSISANSVCIAVADTGVGIKDKDTDKLFHSFSQLSHTKEGNVAGTGLGLAISKSIIQGQGGKILVKSEYGKGTTFLFYLPIKERRRQQ